MTFQERPDAHIFNMYTDFSKAVKNGKFQVKFICVFILLFLLITLIVVTC